MRRGRSAVRVVRPAWGLLSGGDRERGGRLRGAARSGRYEAQGVATGLQGAARDPPLEAERVDARLAGRLDAAGHALHADRDASRRGQPEADRGAMAGGERLRAQGESVQLQVLAGAGLRLRVRLRLRAGTRAWLG